MTEKRTCQECGAELPANAPQGLCPRCLAHMGLGLLQTAITPESDFQVERTGTMIGRYKLLEKIGEGGFGVVYMAEQVEPVQRKVALKIIKAGMDTKEVIARFEAERQAIALMDHPNIARALDAGTTEAGRPYFVMELVRGIPITEYCDQANLPTRERLQLFMKVCQAVQHAHQKGVIHRDLKPSNVLVTEHDGEPVPKVIDFGVAKALGQKLTVKTLFTGFQHMIGTPAYMSPEQAALSGLDIDTRADIYSLGVLLYELLTGVTPFEAEAFRDGALDEIRRMIRETEPPKPSNRLQTLGAKLTEVAKHRGTLPAALNRLICGDLDWIVMRCLEKDRRRRYETANGLAADVARHLDSEPIVARPPSKLYRFQKLVQRNQLAFTAAGAVTAALVIGLGFSIWSWRVAVAAQLEQVRLRQVADADRKRAQTEAARSGQVAQFLKDTLKEVEPSVALGRDGTMLREVLDKTAERVGKELTNQPEVEAELRSTIGNTYFELGVYPKAIAMHREALRLRKSVFGDTNELVALSLNDLGSALAQTSDIAEAEAVQRQALALRRRLLGNDHASVAISLRDLADTLLEESFHPEEAGGSGPQIEGKSEEAEIKAREAVTMLRRLLGKEHPDLAWSLNTLGAVLGARGRLPEAEAIDREALAMWRKLRGDENPEVASSFIKLGKVLEDQGRWPEAEAAYRECLALRRRFLDNDHKWVVGAIGAVGATLWAQGKLAEAEPLFRELLALRIKNYGKESPQTVRQLTDLARILQQEHKYTEAEEALREALATERKLLGHEHPKVAGLLSALVHLLNAQGKRAEAEALLHQWSQAPNVRQPDDAPESAGSPPGTNLIFNGSFELPAHAGDGRTFSGVKPASGSTKRQADKEMKLTTMELVGKPVPKAFKLPLLAGGEMELPPPSNQGLLLLDFCATWCGPCREAMPVLADIAKDYSARGVRYVAVNQGEAPEKIRSYLARAKLDMCVALDQKCGMAGAYRVEGIPTVVIVDRSDIIRYVHVGTSPELGAELRRALDDVLKAESGQGQSSRQTDGNGNPGSDNGRK